MYIYTQFVSSIHLHFILKHQSLHTMKVSARPKTVYIDHYFLYTIFWYAIIGLFFIFATISVHMQTFFYNSYTIDLSILILYNVDYFSTIINHAFLTTYH